MKKNKPLRSLYTPSDEAFRLYEVAKETMGPDGFVDPLGSLKLSAEGLEICGNLKAVSQTMGELVQASLMLPDEDRNGWIVRLPALKVPRRSA